jgi:hypothetical protein
MRHLAATAFIAVAFGCGEGREDVPPSVERDEAPRLLAQETCRSLFACDCPVNPYRSQDQCHDVLELRGHDADMVADAAGLAYDGVCVSRLATTRRELGCDTMQDKPCVPCRPFHGTSAAGEACERLGVTVDVDTCGPGLRCVDRICVELCPTEPILAAGERCAAGIEVLGECEPGLHCDSTTGACTVSPVVGEPCPDRICTHDAWCDPAARGERTCAELRAPGADCFENQSCTSGRCEDGRCTQPSPSVCDLPPP